MTITYKNDEDFLRLTYSEDMESADFVAFGFDPSDEFLAVAIEAGGSDFSHDGREWLAEIA